MESRKIQKVGVSTLTVSLPKEWAEKQQLKKGDQVFMVPEGDSLRLLPPEGARRRMDRPVPDYVIDADMLGEPGMLQRVVVGNYVLGRERLVIRSKGRLRSEHLDEIRNVVRRLMGLGIIEETERQIVLQSSVEPSRFPVDSLIKRLYNLGKTMLTEAMEALITKDRGMAEDAMQREDDADMIYWLLVRLILSAQQDESLITKLGMESRLNNAGYRLISKELETVADSARTIAQTVLDLIDRQSDLDWDLLRPLRDLANRGVQLYGDGLAALLTRDLKLANATALASRELEEDLDSFMRTVFQGVTEPVELLALKAIVDNLERIAEFSHSIANVAFNRYLERSSPLCRAAVPEGA